MRVAYLTVAFLASSCIGFGQLAPFWVGSWASSQQIPEPNNALAADDLRDATLRQVIHLSIGGSAIRVHLSNAFGIAPLHLLSVHVARSTPNTSAAIDPATDKALHFAGQGDVVIPAGAEYISDPLDYAMPAGADLAISIHYGDPPNRRQRIRVPARLLISFAATSFPQRSSGAKKIDHWYQISGC